MAPPNLLNPKGNDLRRYARAHHGTALAIGLSAITAINARAGSTLLQLPTASGHNKIPFSIELLILYAALAVGSLHSRMELFEQAAGRRFKLIQIWHLVLVVAIAVALLAATELAVGSAGLAIVRVRTLLVWTGLAMLSGRIFGWLLAWLLPLISVFPLTYLAQDVNGQIRWWDFTLHNPTHFPSWIIAGVSLAIGATSMLLTPWNTRNSFRRSARTRRQTA